MHNHAGEPTPELLVVDPNPVTCYLLLFQSGRPTINNNGPPTWSPLTICKARDVHYYSDSQCVHPFTYASVQMKGILLPISGAHFFSACAKLL